MKPSGKAAKTKAAAPDEKPVKALESRSFPVVGIGASAGGLEAFTELLRHLPEKTGMAFVLVQHLDPTHGSVLREILARTTSIPVTEVTDGVAVEPNHVYVIPANTNMSIKDGVLRLAARELKRGQHMPIDHFLNSLANERGDLAISVILSGTASDGTLGSVAVKAAGGITFAQEEDSAKYSSMPRNAIHAGCIDFVLSPRGIAKELVRIGSHPYIARVPAEPKTGQLLPVGDEMNTLFAMVREATGVDFLHYKQTTLQRRIKRRMVLHRLEKLKDYLKYIKNNPGELEQLYRDILIHVTGFFREKDAFAALRSIVFPSILHGRKTEDGPLRIWVPGCSTGEEVYSIAIVLLEYLWEEARKNPALTVPAKAVQIFATDISDAALEHARNGLYTDAVVSQVSPERLKRFFLRMDGGYQITKSIREMCIFAKQNVIKDPPFSNLDLISCRNLLIYLGPLLQQRVIPTFHYALKFNGYVMLGSSESLGSFADHFSLIDKKFKIYQKKRTAARLVTYFTGGDYTTRKSLELQPAKAQPGGFTVEKEVERLLVNRYVPASIVVNDEMEIVQFRGKTGPYLEPAAGHPTFSLSKMVREGLLVDLRDALAKAKKTGQPSRKEGVHIQSNGGTREIELEVIPVRGQSAERFFVVVFQEASERRAGALTTARRSSKPEKAGAAPAKEIQAQRSEIKNLRDQLQFLIEDHETTLEEFKSANEEVLSANEELQSTNEELETAKEELQSSNEELTTLNEELQNRNAELTMANNDLLNLLGNVNIPVVMVGNDLRIRRVTPAAQRLLNFLPADVGRRLGEIRPNIDVNDLENIARQTVENATFQEREVHERDGAWHLMRVRPYKTWDNKIEGAVISFQDIDALKRTLDQSRAYADTLIENAREPILVLDNEFRVMMANPAFYRAFRASQDETEGRLIYDLGNRRWDNPKLRTLLEDILSKNTRIDDFEVRHEFPGLGSRYMLLNARRIEPVAGRHLILLSIEDITDRKMQLDALKTQSALLELAHETVIVRDLQGKIFFWNRGAAEMYGWRKDEALGKYKHDLLKPKFMETQREIEDKLNRTGYWEGEVVHTCRHGEKRIVKSRWAVLRQEDGNTVILEINSDITQGKDSEARLRRLSAHLMRIQDEERRRIARELHDSTGQKLAAMGMLLQELSKHVGSNAKGVRAVKDLGNLLEGAHREIRTVAQLLHPPELDLLGLVSATRTLVEGFSERSGIPVDFEAPAQMKGLGTGDLTLFRVVQECLTNIHRHSGAKSAKICLSETPEAVTLEISDDGRGMVGTPSLEGEQDSAFGVGILGMKERLSQLGGTLEISTPGKGTVVRAVLPKTQPKVVSA